MPADGGSSIAGTLIITGGGIITSLIVLVGIIITARKGSGSSSPEGEKGSAVSSLAAVVVERDQIIDEQGQRIGVLEAALRQVDPTNAALTP